MTVDRRPWLAVEVKLKDKIIAKNLIYFTDKLQIPYAYQITDEADIDFTKNNIRVLSAGKFLSGLV